MRRWASSGYLEGFKIGTRGDWRFNEKAINNIILHGSAPKNSHSNALHLKLPGTSNNSTWQKHNTAGHTVQFYESDKFLIDSLSEYAVNCLEKGETLIIVATKNHLKLLEARLSRTKSIDFELCQINGQFLAFDARKTLKKFMTDNMPDKERFLEIAGSMLERASLARQPVRVFGEMVDLLWADGNRKAAIQLEKFWNEAADKYEFSLFCAYNITRFNNSDHCDDLLAINHQHEQTIPAESFKLGTNYNERLDQIVVLQQKAESLENAIKESNHLKDINQAKDEFISIASHQLRTPATAVKQYTGMMLQYHSNGLSEEQRSFIKKAYESNERQLKIIEDLLRVAKLDGGKINLNKSICDLNELIEQVVNDQQNMLTQNNQTVRAHVNRQHAVLADPEYLYMVLENLLSNAIKYSPGGSVISIKSSSLNDYSIIEFIDKGIGIELSDHPKLFQKFSRLNNPQTGSVDGSGLGLYWSQKIVELHGGAITVNSRPGKGSIFAVKLPGIDTQEV